MKNDKEVEVASVVELPRKDERGADPLEIKDVQDFTKIRCLTRRQILDIMEASEGSSREN